MTPPREAPLPPLRLLALMALMASAPGGPTIAQEPAFQPFLNRPKFSLAQGEVTFRENGSGAAPDSNFGELAVEMAWGWDFIFAGRHALTLDLGFFQSNEGLETWQEDGVRLQENDLDLSRFNFSLGYLGSSWDRSLPPARLPGLARVFRFAFGGAGYSRRQAIDRDEFLLLNATPPVQVQEQVEATFEMLGAEVVVEAEVGPRHIISGFVRAKGGGGYLEMDNDLSGALVSETHDDTGTTEAHGTVEAGILSQFVRLVELRLGYRWHYQRSFRVITETELNLGFFEIAFPF